MLHEAEHLVVGGNGTVRKSVTGDERNGNALFFECGEALFKCALCLVICVSLFENGFGLYKRSYLVIGIVGDKSEKRRSIEENRFAENANRLVNKAAKSRLRENAQSHIYDIAPGCAYEIADDAVVEKVGGVIRIFLFKKIGNDIAAVPAADNGYNASDMVICLLRIFRKVCAYDRRAHRHGNEDDILRTDLVVGENGFDKVVQTAYILRGVGESAVVVAVEVILIVFAESFFGYLRTGDRAVEAAFCFAVEVAVFIGNAGILRKGHRVTGSYHSVAALAVLINYIVREQIGDKRSDIVVFYGISSCENREKQIESDLHYRLYARLLFKSRAKLVREQIPSAGILPLSDKGRIVFVILKCSVFERAVTGILLVKKVRKRLPDTGDEKNDAVLALRKRAFKAVRCFYGGDGSFVFDRLRRSGDNRERNKQSYAENNCDCFFHCIILRLFSIVMITQMLLFCNNKKRSRFQCVLHKKIKEDSKNHALQPFSVTR